MQIWTLKQLADRWKLNRTTVFYYVGQGMLASIQAGPNCPHIVTDVERARFERFVQPKIRRGPKRAA